MRVLFSSTSGEGHLNPMLPLAGAFAELGHEVTFAMAPEFAERLTHAGFGHVSAGIGLDELNARTFLPHEGLDGLEPQQRTFASRFALGDAPDRLADLQPLLPQLAPELVVTEPCDLAAPIAAAAAGVPTVLHSFGRTIPRVAYEGATPIVAPLWRGLGLSPPPLCGVYNAIYVDICPPGLQPEALPTGPTVVPLRAGTPAPVAAAAAAATDGRPLVYVTLGTIFNDVERFRLILSGLAEVECTVLLTVGKDNDPSDLNPLPANARVERYIPQHELLPSVDVMVGHGGSGSMLAALCYGIPQLMLPGGADQFGNAEACVSQGAARALAPHELTPEAVRAQVLELLTDPAPRQCARDLAAEIAAMPTPLEAAQRLLAQLQR